MESFRFLYTGGTCEDTSNPQGNDLCNDFNGGPPADTEVIVTCSDETQVLAQEAVSPGDTLQVPVIPDSEIVMCVVTSISTDAPTIEYQAVQFSTQVGFTVKSVFGSLVVEQCDEIECIIDVTYTYTASNVGEAPINITSMTRTRDGETVDLIDLVDPKELDIGQSTIVEETDQVDYCVESVITTSVVISSNGEECAVNLSRRGLLRHLNDVASDTTVTITEQYDLVINFH